MTEFQWEGFLRRTPAFNLTAGRFQKTAAWLKALLVKVLIYKKQELDLRFSRHIVLHDDGIEVLDHLVGDAQRKVAVLVAEEAFTTIHMGSARYFVPGELAAAKHMPGAADAFVHRIAFVC